MSTPTLILASGSPYRRQLLERLNLPFEAHAPDVDERPRAAETAHATVQRLAADKARALSRRFPDAVIIGSDQLALLREHGSESVLGKPGSHARAVAQLTQISGREVHFLTALHVRRGTWHKKAMVPTRVLFRQLSSKHIEEYLIQEPAYDCAGSFKAEGLGISLCRAIHSDDPTALVGLPLIALSGFLGELGCIG